LTIEKDTFTPDFPKRHDPQLWGVFHSITVPTHQSLDSFAPEFPNRNLAEPRNLSISV
jgi:hypothetical protein